MEILKLDIQKTEPDRLSEREVRFQAALLASLASLAVALLLRFGFDAPLVPELVVQLFFAIAPIWMVEIAVGLLGSFAKHLAFLACLVLYLLALIGAAMGYLQYLGARPSAQRSRWSAIAFGVAVWLMTILALLPLLDVGLFGRYLPQGAIYASLTLLLAHLVYGVTLALVAVIYIEKPEIAARHERWLGRRRVLRAISYAVVGVALYDMGGSLWTSLFLRGSGRVKNGDGVFPNLNGLALEVTPTSDFYVVSKNPFDPQVDRERWRLEIGGLVATPLAFTYDELRALPAIEEYATLQCIDNQVGGDLIGNALWRGVRLKDLLAQAGVQESVIDIVLTASDEYRDSIPLARAVSEGALLAYEMNGEPLTKEHGFPLRLIVPGIYGMKNVKWIKKIEAVSYDFKGYWQRRGWDDRAEYKTMSRIDAPAAGVQGATTIAGIAFAGDRGISKVEVSTDGGKTWEAAMVKDALSPYSWALWQRAWQPTRAGKQVIIVRATDGRGVTQTAQSEPVAPSGASGHHRKSVEVEG